MPLRTWTGAAELTALEALSLLTGFLTQPLLMRTLAPTGYGSYAYACAVGLLVGTVTDFGFNYAGVQRAIELQGDGARQHRHFWCVQSAKTVAAAAAVACTLCVERLLPERGGGHLVAAALLGAASAVLFPAWQLLACHRLRLLAGSLLAARCVALALMAWLVRGKGQVGLAVAITLGTPMFAAALLVADRRWRSTQGGGVIVSRAELWNTLRLGASTFWITAWPGIGSTIVQSLIVNLTSSATFGVYAAADRIRLAVQGLFTAFGSAVFPASVALRAGGATGTSRYTRYLLGGSLVLAAAVAGVLAVWPVPIVAFVSGPDFGAAAGVLRILSVAVVTSTFVSTFGIQVLVPLGKTGRYARAAVSGLGVHGLALLLLAPRYGAAGAAIGLVLADAFTAALLLPLLRRHLRAADAGPA